MDLAFKELYDSDMARYQVKKRTGIKLLFQDRYLKKFHFYFRKCQTTKNRILAKYYRLKFKRISDSHHLEIPSVLNVGKGLYLGHPYCITINPNTIIGENCNIHKGVTIGQENRGTREGTPTIGNNVWIGVNAAIVGKIIIGDDVLIAANSYVNRDIPSHSVVVGNPCVAIYKQNATENYINNTV